MAIGIIDMNGAVSWDVIRDALSRGERGVPTLAFGPHVDIEAGARPKPPESPGSCPTASSTATWRA